MILLFVVLQGVVIRRWSNGPFFDEGIYITAGLRTLEGHGISDSYLTWFAGSLLWPVLAAVGHTVAGLTGVRFVALLCVAVAVAGTVGATRNLFGDRAGFWAATALVLNGPLLTLAHLGAYDVPAAAGLGLAFWAITKLARSDDRRWLLLSAAFFSLAVVGKYPVAACGVPLVGLIAVLRGHKAVLDVAMFGQISAAVLLIYYLPLRDQLSQFVSWRVANNPSFGTTPVMVVFSSAYFGAVPILLAAGGWVAARGQRRVATVLLGALALWPAYHVLTRNSVGDHKHLVFGFLFGYPLVGLALSRAWGWRAGLGRGIAGLVVVGLAGLGWVQTTRLDRAWPDVQPAASYLAERVRPGERLLISNMWPFVPDLYARDRIASPWDVYDVYRVEHGQQSGDLCAFDWFVDEEGGHRWPDSVRSRIAACGTFEEVFTTTSEVVNIGEDLNFVEYPVRTSVQRNTHAAPKSGGE